MSTGVSRVYLNQSLRANAGVFVFGETPAKPVATQLAVTAASQISKRVLVEILHDEQVIGSVDLIRFDPSMGVADGDFQRGETYDRLRHATNIDGEDNPRALAGKLSARTPKGQTIECTGVIIEDYRDTLEEIVVTVLGIPYPAYETYFGQHPYYEGYHRNP